MLWYIKSSSQWNLWPCWTLWTNSTRSLNWYTPHLPCPGQHSASSIHRHYITHWGFVQWAVPRSWASAVSHQPLCPQSSRKKKEGKATYMELVWIPCWIGTFWRLNSRLNKQCLTVKSLIYNILRLFLYFWKNLSGKLTFLFWIFLSSDIVTGIRRQLLINSFFK